MSSIRNSKEDWFRNANQYPALCFIGRRDTEEGDLEVLSVSDAQAMLGASSGEQYASLATATILTSENTNTVFDNTGALALVTVDLPVAEQGLKLSFLVTDADGFRLDAAGSNTIRIAGTVTSAGGTMTCTQLGGAVVLYGTSTGWIAASSQRTWIET